MKKFFIFAISWILWVALALISTKDSGEYYTGVTVTYAAAGSTILAFPFFIIPQIGWSWIAIICILAAYLFTGVLFNEWAKDEFGNGVF